MTVIMRPEKKPCASLKVTLKSCATISGISGMRNRAPTAIHRATFATFHLDSMMSSTIPRHPRTPKRVIVEATRMKARITSLLRWSERYTKTDMVYLASSAWWGNLGLVMQSVLSLLLAVAFANWLAPETYGVYQYILSLSALVAAISFSGMNSAVTQAVARGYEGVLRASVRTQLRWAPVPAALTLAVAGYYLFQGNSTVGLGLIVVAIGTPLVQSFNTYSAFLQGKRAFRQSFFFNLFINAAYYAAMFLAIWNFKSAAILVLVNVGVGALTTVYAYARILS